MKSIANILLEIILPITVLTIFCGSWFAISQTRSMSDKFDQTSNNISKKDLKKFWGEADRELIDNQRNILIYKDYLGYEYIFASQKGQENILQKFLND